MNSRPSLLGHASFVLAAAALMALTMALAVVLPAVADFPVHRAQALAGPNPPAKQPTEVVIVPSSIEVIGVRPQSTALDAEQPAAPVARGGRAG